MNRVKKGEAEGGASGLDEAEGGASCLLEASCLDQDEPPSPQKSGDVRQVHTYG